MSIEIIRQRTRRESVSYTLVFDRDDCPGSSFAPECDEHGVVDVAALPPVARQWYEEITTGRDPAFTTPPHVEKYVRRWTEPKLGRCHCGAKVALERFTNTCARCERDYNSAGQELAPREQWGWETNETADEILAVDCTDTDRLLEGE